MGEDKSDVLEDGLLLAEAQELARANGYSGKFPEREDCIGLWRTNRRCWWGRYGKCDEPDFGKPRCLAGELVMKGERRRD